MLYTMVIYSEDVSYSVVYGTLDGVFVFSVMWSELLMTSSIPSKHKTFPKRFEKVLYLKYVFQGSLKRCDKTFLAKRFINV